MPLETKKCDHYIITISSLEEQLQLHDLCVKHNIKYSDEKLFNDWYFHPIWCFTNYSIGLIGTIVAKNTPKENIISGVENFEKLLKSLQK